MALAYSVSEVGNHDVRSLTHHSRLVAAVDLTNNVAVRCPRTENRS